MAGEECGCDSVSGRPDPQQPGPAAAPAGGAHPGHLAGQHRQGRGQTQVQRAARQDQG